MGVFKPDHVTNPAQLATWAHAINAGTHTSYDEPPLIILERGVPITSKWAAASKAAQALKSTTTGNSSTTATTAAATVPVAPAAPAPAPAPVPVSVIPPAAAQAADRSIRVKAIPSGALADTFSTSWILLSSTALCSDLRRKISERCREPADDLAILIDGARVALDDAVSMYMDQPLTDNLKPLLVTVMLDLAQVRVQLQTEAGENDGPELVLQFSRASTISYHKIIQQLHTNHQLNPDQCSIWIDGATIHRSDWDDALFDLRALFVVRHQ